MNNQLKHFNEEIYLLERLRFGQEAAMREIFNLYWYSLHQTAVRKLNSEELAKVAVKDVFATLWDKKGILLITNLSDYLFSSLKLRILHLKNGEPHQ
jgi:RNA polymerase sigma-70 factor (ECF subfamily)